jgi:hypothetical protein
MLHRGSCCLVYCKEPFCEPGVDPVGPHLLLCSKENPALLYRDSGSHCMYIYVQYSTVNHTVKLKAPTVPYRGNAVGSYC